MLLSTWAAGIVFKKKLNSRDISLAQHVIKVSTQLNRNMKPRIKVWSRKTLVADELAPTQASPCHMEGLSAAVFVAGHAGSSGGFTLSALLFTDVTCLHTEWPKFIVGKEKLTFSHFKLCKFPVVSLPCCSVHEGQIVELLAPWLKR